MGKTKKLGIAILVSLVLCFVISLFGKFKYLTDDDWAMMQIVSGGYSGDILPYLCFTNVLIGNFLVLLYKINSGINWYPYYLLFINVISWIGILYAFMRIVDSLKVAVMAFILMFLILLTRHFVELQFTIAAATIYISGLGLLWINRTKISWNAEILIGILFIVLSGLIRKEVIIQMSIGIIPIIAYQLISKRFMMTIGISSALIIYLMCYMYDEHYYDKDPEWAEFKELLSYRELENRYLTYTSMKDVMDEIGWSENDFDLYKSFLLDFDNNVFRKDKVIYMTERFREMSKDKKHIYGFEAIANGIKPYYAIIALTIIASMIFASRKQRFLLLTTYVWTLLICFMIGYNGYHVKDRVIYNYLLLWGMLGLMYALTTYSKRIDLYETTKKTSISHIIILICLLCCSYWNTHYIIKENNIHIMDNNTKADVEYKTLENVSQDFYVSLAPYSTNTYKVFNICSNSKMYCLGWLSGIPLNKEKINKRNNNIIANSIYDKESGTVTWIFGKTLVNKKDDVIDFYKEHYSNEVLFSEEVINIDDSKLEKLTVKFKDDNPTIM